MERATEAAEARAIAREIEKLVGGLSHLALEDAAFRHRDPEDKAGFRESPCSIASTPWARNWSGA